MVNWLKFYFLGFFFDKRGKEAASRSMLNVVLSLLLTFLLLVGGITIGYVASFSTHYENADGFRNFLYAAFVEEGESRVNLSFSGGRLVAQIDGEQCVNTFVNAEAAVSGYRLIVDTRPQETTFDDFMLICKDANGIEIDYEDFKKLPEQGRKNGSISFVYSGKALDVSARQAEYSAYLDNISDETGNEYDAETAAAYGELKHKLNSGEITDAEYKNKIYVLYAKSYYPDYSKVEIYGEAPTLRTYYMDTQLTEGLSKYLILLDDLCICAFETDDGIKIDFGSYYSGITSRIITASGLSESGMRANVDSFIAECFSSGNDFIFLIHTMNIGKFMIALIAVLLVLSLIIFIICRVTKLEFGGKYFDAVKIIGVYLFYSAVITFIAEIILSFLFSRDTVFTVLEAIFISVLAIRTIALLIAEVVRNKKSKKDSEENTLNTDTTLDEIG